MEGKRQLEKRDFGKRLSLDSSLVEYMDSNKYIEHLLTQLEEQHRSLWREKLAVARLQREVAQRTSQGAMHEKLIHELEEERHLRLQSEKRLREVTLESERNRVQMRGLQRQFSRMEETVRNLLQSQGPTEQKREESVNIMTYQEKPSEEERKHKEALDDLHMVVDGDSRSENSSTDEGREKTKLLLERLKALEAENSALALENENQRQQYERCLDEVANQVVQALLTQKDLREECVKLKTRVFDLEQQNRTLSILFQQRVRPTSDLLLQIKEANENLQEDEEDTIADSAFQSHNLESNCQMRTLDSGIGTFPLPESGNRSMGRYICPPDSPEETDPLLSLQPAPSTVSSIRAQTLEREVPSSADSQCSTKTAIVHSISDPIMTARGMRPQSRLPKPASSEIETS
uniref:NCK associated protein 5 n=1 Tax=Marmota marmota marmota TaxID=9994 RepID=A0A8C6ABU9_MARMA